MFLHDLRRTSALFSEQFSKVNINVNEVTLLFGEINDSLENSQTFFTNNYIIIEHLWNIKSSNG